MEFKMCLTHFYSRHHHQRKNRKAELELCVAEIQKSPDYSYDAIIPSLLQVAEVRADYSAQQLTMVGYLKPGYVDFLRRGCSKMIFYFYHTRNGFVYPVHPHLINCKTFAGYTDGEGVIVGNVVGKLQICNASALAEKLAGCGIEERLRPVKTMCNPLQILPCK